MRELVRELIETVLLALAIFLDATLDYYLYDPDTGVPMSLVALAVTTSLIPLIWPFQAIH